MTRTLIAAAALAVLSGCASVGPDFQAPANAAAPSFRHAAGQDTARLPAAWWTVFGDQQLNALEQRALTQNPSVTAAAQRLLQAQAQLGVTRAGSLPNVALGASGGYAHSSQQTSQAIMLGRRTVEGPNYTLGASLSYELDIWGRVRRVIEASDAQALAAQDDRDGVLLILSAQVATTYYQLRGADADIAILSSALATRRETEQLVEARFNAGLSNELDLSRARIERANAQADLAEAERLRLNLEHGLAVLVGASPSTPLLAAQGAQLPAPPRIPVGLPATVLAQRPDLAASVAGLRALNAQIGVAEGAFYPSLSLTGNFGYASENLRQLTEGASRQFGIGPLSLSLPLFDGGRNQANLELAKARYGEALANHQGKLLAALREVEDALSDVQQREQQASLQAQAREAAARAYEVARARYERGVSTYLDVTDAQRSALAAERAAAQITTQRLLAAVAVARALGGGWEQGAPLATLAQSAPAQTR
ncbi:efflux transporter outer membrane subunit [Massilia sp. TS11]|uniref:efflux transporter outer membrane subunit n=1 Tax=Massilia sp. TS11 TaxID=2908003 RepID=UPI0035A33D6D